MEELQRSYSFMVDVSKENEFISFIETLEEIVNTLKDVNNEFDFDSKLLKELDSEQSTRIKYVIEKLDMELIDLKITLSHKEK